MSLLHEESELSEMEETARDREISLGTSTLLGIFFALALVCAAFFGFGYTLGRKSIQPSTGVAAAPSSGSSLGDAFRSFKPSPAGSAAAAPAKDASPNPYAPTGATVVVPTGQAKTPPVKAAFDPDAAVVGDPDPVTVPAAQTSGKPAPIVRQPAAAAAPAGTSIVQVSAFRRQEDADMVASALRRKGYTVSIRQEPQDNYLHVQLGPYATRKEAEAMKDRLSSDGFNALVK